MTPQATLLLAATLLTPLLCGQDKVVPPHLTSTEGQSYFDLPYVYNAGHFQQIWEGPAVCAAQAVITQISFRRDTNYRKSNYAAVTFANATVGLATTKVTPKAMTTNFASNLGSATLTKIVDNKNFSLPAQIQYPTVAPFNVPYPLTAPYIFQRSQGNLLMDWLVPGNATSKSIYTLDGETTTQGTGYVRPFGSFGKFAGGDTPTMLADAGSLVPGGAIAVTVSPLQKQYTAAAFFGFSATSWNGLSLPFDLGILGATGNQLYTGRSIELPMPVTAAKNGYIGQIKLPLPNSTVFSGYRIYAQTWFADQAANNLGVVTSSALELTAGTGNPYTQILGSATSTAATGFFEKGAANFGGPVVKFSGTIN